jgi:hypothetical protein
VKLGEPVDLAVFYHHPIAAIGFITACIRLLLKLQ